MTKTLQQLVDDLAHAGNAKRSAVKKDEPQAIIFVTNFLHAAYNYQVAMSRRLLQEELQCPTW